jgi:flagellar basal-body rod modification protein FlgD
MTVAPTSNATTPTAASGTNSNSSISGDFNQFLTLLTTQLKYQDPLSPMDSTQFTAQLAQFATVEQTSNLNTNMKSLISITQGNQAAAAINYIGKTVQVDNPTATLDSNGAPYTYSLSSQAASTALVITNSLGRAVYATPGETGAGAHSFTWNGKDANGNQLPAGNYTLTVSAIDKNNAQVPATVGSMGVVDGVDSSSNGTVNVVINGVEVPLTKIVSVQN